MADDFRMDRGAGPDHGIRQLWLGKLFWPVGRGFRWGFSGCKTKVEAAMNQHTFELTAAVVFLLIAIAHVFGVIFGVSFVVYSIPVPMWASGIAVVIMGYLAFEGFRLARRT
jgi:fatty acid desaturase